MLSVYKQVVIPLMAAMRMFLSGPPSTGSVTDLGPLLLGSEVHHGHVCTEFVLPKGCSQPMAESSWDAEAGLFLGDMRLLCQLPLAHELPWVFLHLSLTAWRPGTRPPNLSSHSPLFGIGLHCLWMALPSSSGLLSVFFLRRFPPVNTLSTFNLILTSCSWRTQPNTLMMKSDTQGKLKTTWSGSTK